MTRKLVLALGGCALLLLVALLSVSFYWARVSVDATIDEGERWGMRIGDTKAQALSRARGREGIGRTATAVRDQAGEIRFLGELSTILDRELLSSDEWILSSDQPYVDGLTLSFEGDVLVRAHLKRRPFELP